MLGEKRPGLGDRMDGVRVVTVDDASILVLEEVTQEIKDALTARLAEYCYGRVKAAEDPDEYYSFDLTIVEFFKLYDTKDEDTQLGLAGELVVHLLVPHGHAHLISAAAFFNKEESNVKKGFDLTFYDSRNGGLWYGEVKSGRVNDDQTADIKMRSLIGIAERGLHRMFTSDVRKKRWDAAVLDADATLQSGQATSVKKLLRTDFKTINDGGRAKVRALLCGVVVRDLILDEVDSETGKTLIQSVKSRGRFEDVRLLLIQQTDLEDIIQVLRDSAEATV